LLAAPPPAPAPAIGRRPPPRWTGSRPAAARTGAPRQPRARAPAGGCGCARQSRPAQLLGQRLGGGLHQHGGSSFVAQAVLARAPYSSHHCAAKLYWYCVLVLHYESLWRTCPIHERHRMDRPAGLLHRDEFFAGAQHHAVDRAGGQPRPAPGLAFCLAVPAGWVLLMLLLWPGPGRADARRAGAALGRQAAGRGLHGVAGLETQRRRPAGAGRRPQARHQFSGRHGPAVPQHQGLDAGADAHRRLGRERRRCTRRQPGRTPGHHLRRDGGVCVHQQLHLRAGRFAAAPVPGARAGACCGSTACWRWCCCSRQPGWFPYEEPGDPRPVARSAGRGAVCRHACR
jgi:hypothetical protein